MEKRSIQIDLEIAKQWFNGNNKTLKELALQAYDENELINIKYKDICKELFLDKATYYINSFGEITMDNPNIYTIYKENNCITIKQCKKILAINKLINVAKYLNKKWEPNFNDSYELKYYIYIHNDNIEINYMTESNLGLIYFKNKESAEQAINILGEDTIKLALTNNY